MCVLYVSNNVEGISFALWDKRAEGKDRFSAPFTIGTRRGRGKMAEGPGPASRVLTAQGHDRHAMCLLQTPNAAGSSPKYSISIKKSSLSFTHLRTHAAGYSTVDTLHSTQFNVVRVDKPLLDAHYVFFNLSQTYILITIHILVLITCTEIFFTTLFLVILAKNQ